VEGIDSPCEEISFSYVRDDTATLVMKFSRVGGDRLVTLQFTRVVVLCAEEECPGGFIPLPGPLPKLGRGVQPGWTFPLLKLVDSEALAQYDAIFHRKNQPLAHFCLISLHNLVQVIASADVKAVWNP